MGPDPEQCHFPFGSNHWYIISATRLDLGQHFHSDPYLFLQIDVLGSDSAFFRTGQIQICDFSKKSATLETISLETAVVKGINNEEK